MRLVFWLLLLLGVALALALATRFDSGYVLIVSPPWRVDMSLPLAIGLAVLTFLAGYLAVRLLRRALLLPADLRAWRERRRKGRAEDELSRAVAALLAGQPAHARKLADQALARAASPLAALVAAHAALGAEDRAAARDYLEGLKGEAVPADNGELIAARQALERVLAQHPSPPATPG